MKEALKLACAADVRLPVATLLMLGTACGVGAALATYGAPGALIRGRASRCYLIGFFTPPAEAMSVRA